jgi:hypothetical protein
MSWNLKTLNAQHFEFEVSTLWNLLENLFVRFWDPHLNFQVLAWVHLFVIISRTKFQNILLEIILKISKILPPNLLWAYSSFLPLTIHIEERAGTSSDLNSDFDCEEHCYHQHVEVSVVWDFCVGRKSYSIFASPDVRKLAHYAAQPSSPRKTGCVFACVAKAPALPNKRLHFTHL